MTPLFLQDALLKDIGALLQNLQVAGGNFKGYGQNLPPRKADKDYSIYPFFRVLLCDGVDDDTATQDVVIVLCVRDPGEDMQGHRDIMNAIQRIREHYRKHPEIASTFSVTGKIRWTLPEDSDTYPEFYGAVLLTVAIPQISVYSELT